MTLDPFLNMLGYSNRTVYTGKNLNVAVPLIIEEPLDLASAINMYEERARVLKVVKQSGFLTLAEYRKWVEAKKTVEEHEQRVKTEKQKYQESPQSPPQTPSQPQAEPQIQGQPQEDNGKDKDDWYGEDKEAVDRERDAETTASSSAIGYNPWSTDDLTMGC